MPDRFSYHTGFIIIFTQTKFCTALRQIDFCSRDWFMVTWPIFGLVTDLWSNLTSYSSLDPFNYVNSFWSRERWTVIGHVINFSVTWQSWLIYGHVIVLWPRNRFLITLSVSNYVTKFLVTWLSFNHVTHPLTRDRIFGHATGLRSCDWFLVTSPVICHVIGFWSCDWCMVTWPVTDHVLSNWSRDWLLVTWLFYDHVTCYLSRDRVLIMWLIYGHVTDYYRFIITVACTDLRLAHVLNIFAQELMYVVAYVLKYNF